MADEVLSQLPLRGDEPLFGRGCGEGKLMARIVERLPAGTKGAAA
jgi:cyclopropane fatty-acyl-phospholipid synthase-like methyltransferase